VRGGPGFLPAERRQDASRGSAQATTSSLATTTGNSPTRSKPSSSATSSIAVRRTWKCVTRNPRSAQEAGSAARSITFAWNAGITAVRNVLPLYPKAVIGSRDWFRAVYRNENRRNAMTTFRNCVRQPSGRLDAARPRSDRPPVNGAIAASRWWSRHMTFVQGLE